MKYNKFQQKVNEIFNKNIEQGVIIKAPRQSGKTTFILLKAKELAKQEKKVRIITHSYAFARELQLKIESDNIQVVGFSWQEYPDLKKFIPDYIFYDEPWLYSKLIVEKENHLFIGTSTRNEFIFGKSWLDINEKVLETIRKESSEDRFRTEFNSNIMEEGE